MTLGRKVDHAMSEERPEKVKIRRIWADVVRNVSVLEDADNIPLFLTLSGEEAKDIRYLIEEGIIEVNEVGGLTEKFLGKIIAVESSPQASLKLQRNFPGLKIIEQPFKNLVSGDSLTTYPEKRFKQLCRARVINLDLNNSLIDKDGEFGIFQWIVKLCNLHAEDPRINWSLCLTLQGEVRWSEMANIQVHQFLKENFERSEEFLTSSSELLGSNLIEQLTSNDRVDFSLCSRDEQQAILMLFVPKKIIHLVHATGWKVITEYNLKYGAQGHAPMVTWVFNLEWDANTIARPNDNYLSCLHLICEKAGHIDAEGELVK